MRAGGLVLLATLPALAWADGWGGMAGIVSDYAYRGLTLSNQSPSLQADLHYYGKDNWYTGLGLASVQRDPAATDAAEIGPYLGRAWPLDQDWNVRLTLSHYAYLDRSSDHYDYDEVEARLGFRQRLALSVAASPNTAGDYTNPYWFYPAPAVPVLNRRGAAYATELALTQPLMQGWTAEAGLGYRDLRRVVGIDYVYWSAGLDFMHGPFSLDIARIGTSAAAEDLCCGQEPVNRWVVGAFWHF